MMNKWIDRLYQLTSFNKKNYSSLRNPLFLVLAFLMIISISLAYSNHFSNGFHFDDSHTINDNNAIKEVDVVKFFTDASTFSALTTNQAYRPYTTLENAIDYKLAGGLEPQVFHLHIFLSFVLTCLVLCFFVKKLLDKINYSNYNQFWGLLVATLFGLLCANAETVNYIIQRAEIISGLYVLLGFSFFLLGGNWRKKYLYLLFPFIGFFAKEMTFVFAPLLLLYFLIFEEDVDLLHFYRKVEFKKCLKSFGKAAPAFVLTIAFYIFYNSMLPETFNPGGLDRIKYLITQPMVMLHYIVTYFVPYNLTADSDWMVYDSIWDYRAILGILGILILALLSLKASKKRPTKLFSFGMLWFFITLLPSSSFIAFAEVQNDHRSFIPYMGLTIAFVFGTIFLLERHAPKLMAKKAGRIALATLLIVFLSANAYGVYQRNKVWKDELSLWHDVTIKSPKNGRGMMNYGLALMEKADYENAEKYFNKALELTPNYPTLFINLGILKAAKGNSLEAEEHFKKAITLNVNNHTSHYYYGRYLLNAERFEEAKISLQRVLEISPNFGNTNQLLMKAYHGARDWNGLKSFSGQLLQKTPNDEMAKKYSDYAIDEKSLANIFEEEVVSSPSPEKYLDLSLKYFNESTYEKCISAAEKAIEMKPDYPEAYNNIGIAYFYLKNYRQAIAAYTHALKLKPGYALAENNLMEAQTEMNKTENSNITALDKKASDNFINISLTYYNAGKFVEAIEAAKKSIEIMPNANAYNNICSSYNQLKQYDKAITACEKALKLDANHKLAKGNLAYAQQQHSKDPKN